MIKLELIDNPKYKFCYLMTEDNKNYCGGLNKEYFLVLENNDCPYKEMMLRALINKCMNEFILKVYSYDIWDINLTKFGFKKQGGFFASGFADLKLPHKCNC
jgi:hypothetical protein